MFSTKVVLEDTNFNCATGDGSAILRGHPDHAKASRFAGHDFGHRKCIKVQVCFGNCVITSLRCFSYYTVTKTNLNFLCVS